MFCKIGSMTNKPLQQPYGLRLEQALKWAGISQSKLAEKLEIKQQSISHAINKGNGSEHTTSIANALGVNPNWLEKGLGNPKELTMVQSMIAQYGSSNVQEISHHNRPIPVISTIQAGNWREAIAQNADEYLYSNKIRSINSFALEINGKSMMPDFHEGEYIIVDPDVQPNPGDYVVAQNGKDEATFKKYRPRGINENAQEVFELVPLNPDFPVIRSDREKVILIGTVMDHLRSFRK
jgi:SOS-response transcriptional repressor LexA